MGKNLTCNDYCYHAQEAGKAANLVHVAGKILNFNQQIDPKYNAQNTQNEMSAASMKNNRASTL